MTVKLPDARRYARIRYRLMLIELIGWLGFLWAYHAVGLSATTARWLSVLTPMETVRLAGCLAVFGICSYLVFFPLHLYGGFILEHQFGLSRLRFSGWLIREGKQNLLGRGSGCC